MRTLLPLLVLACAAPDGTPDDAVDTGLPYFSDSGALLPDSHANVIRTFGFTTVSDGVTDGFDLDGITSSDGDDASCGHGDFADASGRAGIDNQLADIWSLAAPLVGEQVEELLQGSINEGRMLMVLELEGLDDLGDDDDLTLHLYRATGDPEIGTFGLISPDQTFSPDAATPDTVVEGVRLEERVLEAGPIQFDLPIDILEARFAMAVTDGRVRLELADDGTMTGVIGGVVDVRAMLDELLATDAAAEAALVAPMFENAADMWHDDGTCGGLSVAFRFQGTRAFVVRRPDDAP